MDFAGLRGRRWTSREPGDAGRQRSACTRSRTTSRCSEQWCDRSISEAAQWQQRSEASSGAHTRSTRSSAAQRDATRAARHRTSTTSRGARQRRAQRTTTTSAEQRSAAQRDATRCGPTQDTARPDAAERGTRLRRRGARQRRARRNATHDERSVTRRGRQDAARRGAAQDAHRPALDFYLEQIRPIYMYTYVLIYV